MNINRKNNEEEIVLFEAKFKKKISFPILPVIIIFVGIITFLILTINAVSNNQETTSAFYIVAIIILILILVAVLGGKKKELKDTKSFKITNKRIQLWEIGSFEKNQSFRYDMIETVEMTHVKDSGVLSLTYTTGIGSCEEVKKISVSNITNYLEGYDCLCRMLCSVKNDKDI